MIRPQSGNQFVSERIRAYQSVIFLEKLKKNDPALLADIKRDMPNHYKTDANFIISL